MEVFEPLSWFLQLHGRCVSLLGFVHHHQIVLTGKDLVDFVCLLANFFQRLFHLFNTLFTSRNAFTAYPTTWPQLLWWKLKGGLSEVVALLDGVEETGAWIFIGAGGGADGWGGGGAPSKKVLWGGLVECLFEFPLGLEGFLLGGEAVGDAKVDCAIGSLHRNYNLE